MEHRTIAHVEALCGRQIKAPRRAVIGAIKPNIAKEQGVSNNGTSRVVLVVEDEWAVRSLIAFELQSAGWDVLQATTAEEAIRCLQRGDRVDIVFTDIQLAGFLSGWDVAEHFRAVRADMPIIYTSGNSLDRARRVGGSLFFDMPYQPATIVEACAKLA